MARLKFGLSDLDPKAARTSAFGGQLRKLITDYKRGMLDVAITIDGHDYWWFLEFGTAAQDDLTPVMSPIEGEIFIERPASILPAKRQWSNYPISAHGRYTVRKAYTPAGRDKLGRNRTKMIKVHGPKRKLLRFIGTNFYAGKLIRVAKVSHPGLPPKMQLRKSIQKFQLGVLTDINYLILGRSAAFKSKQQKDPLSWIVPQEPDLIPTWTDLYEIVKENAELLRQNIYNTTPVSPNNDAYWGNKSNSLWSRDSGEHLRTVIKVEVRI